MDMKLFERESHVKFRAPKGKCFIYLLKNNGENVYVGQTVDLFRRSQWHKGSYNWKVFDQVFYFECDKDRANEMEAKSIVKYKPLLNGNLPKNNHYLSSKTLFERLHRFIRDNQDAFDVAYLANRDKKEPIPYVCINKVVELENAIYELLEKK